MEAMDSVGHRGYVRAVGVAQSGRGPRLLSCGYDGLLIAWTFGLEEVARVRAHREGVGTLAVCTDGRVATSGGDGVVRVWTLGDGGFERLEEHRLPAAEATAMVETLRWSHDGANLVAGSVEGRLFLLQRDGSLREVEREGGFLSINAVRFTHDDRYLFVASDQCQVHVYRRSDLALVAEVGPFDDHVDGLTLLPERNGVTRVMAVTHGPAVWAFEFAGESLSPKGLERLSVGRMALNAVAHTAEGEGCVLVGGDARTVYEVAPDLSAALVLAQVPRDIDDLAVLDEDRVAVATTGGLYVLSRSRRGVLASRQRLGALAAVTVSEGRVIVGAHDHGALYARPLSGGERDARRYAVSAPVSCAAPGAAVFGLANGAVVELCGEEIVERFRGTAEIEAVWGSADGASTLVAVDRVGNAVRVTPRGARCLSVSRLGDRLKAVIPCPWRVGAFLAAGKDRALYLLDFDAGTVETVPWDHGAKRTFNALATAGGLVFGASWDARIHVGEVGRDGKVRSRGTLDGHTQSVDALVAGGDRLVSASYDGTLRTWSLKTLAHEATVQLSESAVRRLCACVEDHCVWAASYDGRVRRVDVVAARVVGDWTVSP